MELKPPVSRWKIVALFVNQEVGWLLNIKHASHCGRYHLVFCWECGNEIHIPYSGCNPGSAHENCVCESSSRQGLNSIKVLPVGTVLRE